MPDDHTNEKTDTVAMTSIETQGNWFLKNGERFLIKGLTYGPRRANGRPWDAESYIDPLGEEWLPELRTDIPLFHQLGINTIFVDHADPTQSPERALQLLHDEGIYVLLELFTNIHLKDSHQMQAEDVDVQRLYSPSKVRKNLALVGQTAHFPNVLGYSISQSTVGNSPSTRLAALHRAAVRDTKLYLRKCDARQIPVGANMSANQQFRRDALQYMTAASPEERVDFMSFGVYDWVGPSSFLISGYKNLCEAYEPWPVPMFFAEYGSAYPGRPRVMDEVECLFSSNMTGVFSGGFLHTYGHTEVKHEPLGPKENEDDDEDDEDEDEDAHGDEDDDEDEDAYGDEDDDEDDDGGGGGGGGDEDDNGDDGEDGDEHEGGYDLVRIEGNGSRRPKRDFALYQQRLANVDSKPVADVFGGHTMKDFEGWRGQFDATPRFWEATAGDVPLFPLDWDLVVE